MRSDKRRQPKQWAMETDYVPKHASIRECIDQRSVKLEVVGVVGLLVAMAVLTYMGLVGAI